MFLLFMFFFLYLIILGVFSKTIVNKSLFDFYWTKILTIMLVIYFITILFNNNSWLNRSYNFQNISKTKRFLSIIIGIPLIITLIFERGIPIFLHQLIAKPSQKLVIVNRKIKGYRKSCKNGVVIVGYSDTYNGRVCGLKADLIKKISKGDKIILFGESSLFGFSYHKYSYIGNIDNKYLKRNK